MFVCLLTVLVCRNCFDDETKRIDRYRSSDQKSNSNGGGGNGISRSSSSSIKEEEELPWLKEKLRFILEEIKIMAKMNVKNKVKKNYV